ncbi:hypothetical protein QDA09_gp91 [Microbacterium phage Tyrumbra]|uniref:Uncharacterized protein n=1 Tax=Microbacterium phage Tyrumbra TaxID=2596974 RepID=A0A516KPM7_9CAUD|nr:hypothetical protein QDA09_gp91 [Microbacterium phage Tyrumbra]QDP43628.1 hypothetical protein SEA_TYRUMBRA_91 [Microbacterium phage Tyrumbra]
MSDIYVKPRTASVTLRCDKCGTGWESDLYRPERWGDEVKAAQPAFDAGWTLYVAARGRRVYCPHHRPTVPMRLLHGTPNRG